MSYIKFSGMRYITQMILFIKHIWIFIKKIIYIREDFFIYRSYHKVNIESPVIVKCIEKSNVRDVLTFNSESYIEIFNHFIDIGDKGYYAYLDGDCVHRSWLKLGPQKIQVIHGYLMDLKENDIYVHYCETSDKVRGMSIYPFVLTYICNEFKNKNVYSMALEKKKYARRGLEKAGFEKVKHIIIKRLFGFNKIKETNLVRNI